MSNFSQAIEKLNKQAGSDDMKCVLAEILIDTMTEDRADAIVNSKKDLSEVISKMHDEAKKKAIGGSGSISPRRAIEIAAEVFGFATNGEVISTAKEAPAPKPAAGAVHVDLLDLL